MQFDKIFDISLIYATFRSATPIIYAALCAAITQQADILTSELDYYRRLLTPVIVKICRTFLRLHRIWNEPQVEWSSINLQDEVEHAQARLYNAQADALLRAE